MEVRAIMSSDEWTVNSEEQMRAFMKHFNDQWIKHKFIRAKLSTGKQRTNLQNAALHRYCELLASNLNEKGFDMHMVLNNDIEVPWTKELVKELIWRPVQKSQTQEASTTKAERVDYSKVYDIINRYIGGKFGISVEWPERGNHAHLQ